MSISWLARCAPLTLGLVLAGCAGGAPKVSPGARLRRLRADHERLHRELEVAVGQHAVATRASSDTGQIVVAIQSKWIEDLMTRVAGQYLDRVTLDLASVEAHAGGRIDKDSFLGHFKVGDWRVEVVIDSLRGLLAAGRPRLVFSGRDLLKIELPVRVQPAPGKVSIRFAWDSASVANVVCKDFELTRTLAGSVPAQTLEVKGALRFSSEGGSIVAVPLFPERTVALRMDLSPESWATVDEALGSQNSLGKCGLLLNPEVVVAKLRELTQQGIRVTLPASIFRTVRLPARIEKVVEVAAHKVGVEVSSERLGFEHEVLWSSATVRVAAHAADEQP